MSQNKFIKLEVNGRIFPHWVIHNFKKYTLPKILLKEGQDPCDIKLGNELAPYQKFLGQFLRYDSPFRDMLIIHGMGSGKTASAVNIYNILFNYTPKWNIFIIIPASLEGEPVVPVLNSINESLTVVLVVLTNVVVPLTVKLPEIVASPVISILPCTQSLLPAFLNFNVFVLVSNQTSPAAAVYEPVGSALP